MQASTWNYRGHLSVSLSIYIYRTETVVCSLDGGGFFHIMLFLELS